MSELDASQLRLLQKVAAVGLYFAATANEERRLLKLERMGYVSGGSYSLNTQTFKYDIPFHLTHDGRELFKQKE